MANTPTASPKVKSTIGLQGFVIAPITNDTHEEITYGTAQKVAGMKRCCSSARVR